MIKRILCSVGVFALIPAILWVGGVDFDQRGPAQAITLYCAVAAGLFCYAYPGWRDE